jgi:hypothetical protein
MKSETKRYKYPLQISLLWTVFPLIGLSVGLVLWLCGTMTIFAELFDLAGRYPTAGEGLGLLVGGCAFVIGAGTVSTLHTEIIVTNKGMKARVLIIGWVFIPWEDILDIGVVPMPRYNDPSTWRYIRAKKLTCFHRLASLSYGTGTDPVLIIYKRLDGYKELLQTIEEHVGHGADTSG